MNWYPRYYGDYTRDTSHLTLAEHGAYNVLLDHYYATGPIPDDMPTIMRICRAFDQHEQKAVESVVATFFPVNSDGLRHNKKADKVISQQAEKSEKAAQSARARWDANAKQPHSEGDANAMRTQCEGICGSDAIQIQITDPEVRPQKPDHNNKNSSERSTIRSKPPVLQPDQVFISIPVTGSKDGNQEYPLSHDQVAEWEQLFPAVDVRQTLREIRAWNMANPKRRKTASGVVRHVASWLTKEQNKG